MLGFTLRPLIRICDSLIVRNYRRRLPSGQNPGLDRRVTAFKREGLKIEDNDAEEFIESSESDFANVGEAYNEHMNETLVGNHNLRQRIVKEKYFKENMPNLLTWSEKEQIRHLSNTNPEEWTPERIAESFPVTVPIVKKLLKYPWKPATEQRIARHDASALRNWRELHEGTFNIDETLRQHFLKFSNRTIPPLSQESVKVNITPEHKKMGEFQRIVQRCAQRMDDEDTQQQMSESNEGTNEVKTNRRGGNKIMTLDDLADTIKRRMDSGSTVDINDEMITKSVYRKKSEVSIISENKEIQLDNTNEVKELQEYKTKDSENEKSIMHYPERIRIPKKAYKKGATYKVNDCYYDHDGRFLYRVLGMSNT